MKFKLLKRKKNDVVSSSNINEKTQEKFILKRWIESNRKPTCTNKRTRGFLFGSQTPSKMDFSAGRSMVEMLGVLAIIGVLSIGGIQGYTIAMRKHKANEILNTLQKYATIIYSNCLSYQLNTGKSTIEFTPPEGIPKQILDCPNPIPFTSAGLGGFPSGLKSIDMNNYGDDWNGWNIIRTNSGDIVRFYINLESHELCETVFNTAGTIPTDPYNHSTRDPEYWGSMGSCQYSTSTDALVSFIMN